MADVAVIFIVLTGVLIAGLLHECHSLLTHARAAENEVERIRAAIRHEYREARAHRTDNRSALTRLYRLEGRADTVEAPDG